MGKSHKLVQYMKLGQLTKLVRISPFFLVNIGLDLTQAVVDQFKAGKRNAKVAGKLLAYTLAMRYPFTTQSISLVGFSLGSQVIKSCLKTLHELGATDIIHNVTFMGAAIDRLDRDEKSSEKWSRIFS